MEELKIGVILAQMINFVLLIFLFKFFLGKKLGNIIEERKKKLKLIEEAENEASRKLNEAHEEAEKIIEEARKKGIHIEEAIHARAMHKKEQMLATAHFQAENMLATARADLDKEKTMMISFLKSKVLGLAYSLNQKLFTSKKVNRDFMEQELFKFSQEKDT